MLERPCAHVPHVIQTLTRYPERASLTAGNKSKTAPIAAPVACMDAPLLEKTETNGVLAKLKAAFAPTRAKWANSPATVPNMLFLALVFGIVSGVVAWLYSLYFEGLLDLVWKVSLASVPAPV